MLRLLAGEERLQLPDQSGLLRLAQEASLLSPDRSTKVGCVGVITCELTDTVLFGFSHNSFVPEDWCQENSTREERWGRAVHAEQSFLLSSGCFRGKKGLTLYLYCTHEPCADCWKAITFSRARRVVFWKTDEERRARWNCDKGRRLALEMGTEIVEVEKT